MKDNIRVAVVTGASSGIGRAIAEALVVHGYRVTLMARRSDRMEAVASSNAGATLVAPVDVRNEQKLIRAFEVSQEHWGRLDVLINAAGLAHESSLTDGSTDEWREMLEVNVLALAVASREALRRFDREKGGHIVHMSSMSGHRVTRRGAMYTATKFAVRSMAESLRCELRDSGNPTRVSCVSPGFVDTEFFETYFKGDQEKIQRVRTGQRILTPEDVAASVVHILEAPEHVEIHDVLMRSNEQLS